jgi:diguanylate cyclase (GGDEF)-like protein
MNKKKYLKTNLFTRISMGFIVPLLFLAALFAAVQLANEMNSLNDSYRLRSRFALESIHKTFQIALAAGNFNDRSLPELGTQLQQAHPGINIRVYDVFNRRFVFNPLSTEWTPENQAGLESALQKRESDSPYFVKIDRESQRLNAYLPLFEKSAESYWIVHVDLPLPHLRDALIRSRSMLAGMLGMIVLTGIAIGTRLARSIIRPVESLNRATREIMQGHLGRHVQIHTGDEIEMLANTFNEMSDALITMKKRAEDANPLTGLPGNQGIFQEIKRRLHERQKFVLFHIDIDRFKVFNDHFGLAKGDEAIKRTSSILRTVAEKTSREDTFIGHQGGDDFVAVLQPSKAKDFAEEVIREFDQKALKELYSKEDFERNYTLQIDRRRLAETGEEKLTQFPLIAISLAGVSNSKKDFADYFDCMSAAVSVKKDVKKIIQSSYLIKE